MAEETAGHQGLFGARLTQSVRSLRDKLERRHAVLVGLR